MKILKQFTAAVLLLSIVFCVSACDSKKVSDQAYEYADSAIKTIDMYLDGDTEVLAAYVALYAIQEQWANDESIEQTSENVTVDFQAKLMLGNLVESFAKESSGENVRAQIIRQRNRLAVMIDVAEIKG